MKYFNQTTVTIVACLCAALFLYIRHGGGGSPEPRQVRYQSMNVDESRAQDLRKAREERKINLPDGSELGAEFVREQIKLISETPFEDKDLSFALRIPKTWNSSPLDRFVIPGMENDYSILTPVAKYSGPPIMSLQPFVEVKTVRLTKDIDLYPYAQIYFKEQAIAPETIQMRDDGSVDALYVQVFQGTQSYAIRARFFKQGDMAVSVHVALPLEAYGKYKHLLGLIINSFQFENPFVKDVEQKSSFRLLNILKFNHYESWVASNINRTSTADASLKLIHQDKRGGVVNGAIYIRSIRKDRFTGIDLDAALKMEIKRIEDKGYRLSGSLGDKPLPDTLAESYPESVRKTYKVQPDDGNKANETQDDFSRVQYGSATTDVYLDTSIVSTPKYYVFFSMLSPTPDSNYRVWAQNQFGYRQTLDSLVIRE